MLMARRGFAALAAAVPAAPAEPWYGLIDLINGNDATSGRRYTIDHAAALDLPATGWAWPIWYELGSLDTGPSYLINAGTFGGSPSFSLFITGTGQTTPNAIGLNVNGNGIETANNFVQTGEKVLVVPQYDGTTLELWTCKPGEAAVLRDSVVVALGNIVAPTSWQIGARADLDDERFLDQLLGGPCQIARALTPAEMARLALGWSPVADLGADCAGAWAFADGPQETEPDISANDNAAARQGTGWPGQVTPDGVSIIGSGQSHTSATAGSGLASPRTIPVTLDDSVNRKIVLVLSADAEQPTSAVFEDGNTHEAAFTRRLTVGDYIEIWDVDIPDAVPADDYSIVATAGTDPLPWSVVAIRDAAAGAPHSTDTFGPVGAGPSTDTGVLTTVPDGALIIGAVSHDAYASSPASYAWASPSGTPIKLMDGNLTGDPFFMAGAATLLVDGGGNSVNLAWTATNQSSNGYAAYACYGPAS